MSGRRKAKKPHLEPATEVEIRVKVTIRETHARTGVLCDERSKSYQLDVGNDFEAAQEWLSSDEAWDSIMDVLVDACADWPGADA